MKIFTHPMGLFISAAAITLRMGAVLCAQDSAVIWHEEATSPAGPWKRIAPNAYPSDSDGNPIVPLGQSDAYFRTRISKSSAAGSYPSPIPLGEMPPEILSRAAEHVANFAAGTGDDPDGGWEDVAFAPLAYPVFDPLQGRGALPAYVELELLPASPEAPLQGGFLKTAPTGAAVPRGYVLVSLTEDDFPIAEFATEGATRCQDLAVLAGTTQFKAVRYGSTFWAAETSDGQLLANFGTQPIKPDPNFLSELRKSHAASGNDATGANVTPENPTFRHGHYRSYAEFKEDYATNPIYTFMSARRKALAKPEWDASKGVFLPVLDVAVGKTAAFFASEKVDSFNLVTEEISAVRLATLTPGRLFGLQVTGHTAGHGTLEVTIAGRTRLYDLQVTDEQARLPRAFTPGWQPTQYFYASSWAEQPRHYQVSKSDLCPLMGCGPVAWSIYFVWVENAKNVKAAFGNLTTSDGSYNQSASNNSTLVKQQRVLHDMCDVICDPFGDSGATWPSDMTEGGLGYSWIPAQTQFINRSWRMDWDLGDVCSPAHGLYCRDAIKGGYIAPVGLGWLWHYAVAYGYAYQNFEAQQGQVTLTKRFLKCNMGWGNHAPCWFNLCDTFWGADFRITNGAAAQ